MLTLTATLVGKSAHRDGGYILTFMVQGQEFKVRVDQMQGAKFADTATVIQPKDGGAVKTVHATDLKQYVLTIDAPKAEPAKPVPAKPVVPPPATPAVKPEEKPTT